MVDWLHVERAGKKSVELLALRARQRERRREDIQKAAEASGRVERQIASTSTNIVTTDLRERITSCVTEIWCCYMIRNSTRRTHTNYQIGGLGRIG